MSIDWISSLLDRSDARGSNLFSQRPIADGGDLSLRLAVATSSPANCKRLRQSGWRE
ncbi:hypothetical protein LAC81_26935 [Ensifer adhaerens]|uniref:hypothetical protein n=1 Tax=Ensifer adhaerens TaxID=106592 RepID=UPI001CC1787C|nr:hypothetical protein [Ensifer adhaerens]MBZ7924366.1 hypothetical protein [Ensifer adhaerens]UAX96385.1 hypothetical protein LAC78_21550 [Ensifer adhaerens]UAY04272.1 hypothetical protein LAC80_23410 [Ensifer adhaerens]UAY12258.1 hypothetical protein LAC81_26935 [Ensifer adhaerens]